MPEMDGFETAALIRAAPDARAHADHLRHRVQRRACTRRAATRSAPSTTSFSPFVPEVLRTKVAVFVELYRTQRAGAGRQAEERIALAARAGGSRRRGGDESAAGRPGRGQPRADAAARERLDRRRSAPGGAPYMADLAAPRRRATATRWPKPRGSGSASMPTAARRAAGRSRRAPGNRRRGPARDCQPERSRPCPRRTARGTWAIVAPLLARGTTLRRHRPSPCSIRVAATPRPTSARPRPRRPRRHRARQPQPLSRDQESDRRKDEFLAMLGARAEEPARRPSRNAAAVLEKLGRARRRTTRMRRSSAARPTIWPASSTICSTSRG